MTISVGDALPGGMLLQMGAAGAETVDMGAKLKGRNVVVFGLPGAFTGTCTTSHVPGFMRAMDKLRAKGIVKQNHPNNYLLQRISGISFDFMVTAAVAIMSFTAIAKYWLPTAVIGIAGGLVTIWWCTWIGRKVFRKYPLENLAAQYGMLTGTISTGMALLREVDPDFRSDAADNLVLGSGTGLAFGLPLLIVINLPVQGYLKNEPWYYFLTLAIIVVYLIALTVLMTRRRKAKAEKPSKSPS